MRLVVWATACMHRATTENHSDGGVVSCCGLAPWAHSSPREAHTAASGNFAHGMVRSAAKHG